MLISPTDLQQHIADAWPDANLDDCLWIYPLGSRKDYLIFHRKLREVTTGRRGNAPCFKGTLAEFSDKLEEDYGKRLEVPYGELQKIMRLRAEYRQAINFLKSLPDM